MVKHSLKIMDDLMLRETLAPILSSEKGRYASFAILIVTGVILLMTVMNTFSEWYSDFMISHKQVAVTTATISNQDSGLIASLPAQHLFGMPATEDSLPITSLQLRLTGIIQNSNSTSRVIISEAGASGKVFSLGDEVVSGFKINAINEDGVVLERGGHFEKLPLARTTLTFTEKPKSLWQM